MKLFVYEGKLYEITHLDYWKAQLHSVTVVDGNKSKTFFTSTNGKLGLQPHGVYYVEDVRNHVVMRRKGGG